MSLSLSSEVHAIPVPVVMVHCVLPVPLMRVVLMGLLALLPIMNWLEAEFVALKPRAIEFEKFPVEVFLPIRIEYSEVVLSTKSFSPAFCPIKILFRARVALDPDPAPTKTESVALRAPAPAPDPKNVPKVPLAISTPLPASVPNAVILPCDSYPARYPTNAPPTSVVLGV